MDILSIFGYLGALMVGIILGLIGGGGSILTVPILVYLIGLNPVTATAYSLFVVGTTSIFGAVKHIKDKSVNIRIAIIFAIPALITVYLTRRFLVPVIPESLFTFFNIEVTKHIFIMLFFASIMLLASFSMIKSNRSLTLKHFETNHHTVLIIIEGIVVGVLTGIVGAGGGFLIVPALVILGKLPMKLAIGTSLIIISMKSLIGFLGDIQNIVIDWTFLIMFTAISVIGIYIGIYIAQFISGTNLKKGFGWFTLLMACYIIFRELSLA
ncbi:sulfite exporter TauE/SafE family protein [Flavobacteriaceae bacterium]|jgi:uncharacterized protein|nr:sulfite exporter TauE/SafE family protein [Flavobacteriaceae bacterium]